MLDAAAIDELASFDGGGAPVLSVYLSLDPARQVRRSYRIAFEDLVRDARERLERPVHEAFVQDTVRARAWLEGQEPRGAAWPSSPARRVGCGRRTSCRWTSTTTSRSTPGRTLPPCSTCWTSTSASSWRSWTRSGRGSSSSLPGRSRRRMSSRTSCPAGTTRVASRRPTTSATTKPTSSGISSGSWSTLPTCFGADVEVLHGDAGGRLLKQGGGLGALLRYRPPTRVRLEEPGLPRS